MAKSKTVSTGTSRPAGSRNGGQLRVAFHVMNNCAPVPVARPADQIQLTPIVQPIPLVPYSSQLQPLAQFDDDYDNGDYDDYE